MKKKSMKNLLSKTLVAGMILTSIVPQTTFAAQQYNVKILAGSNRYETSAYISQSSFNKSDKVIIASGEKFADALSAGNFADEAPILLVKQNEIPREIKKEIKRLNPSTVIIVGGTSSISDKVAKEFNGKSVIRYAGKDRFETSKKISDSISSDSGVVLVNGYNFADALSANYYTLKFNKKLVLCNGKSSNVDKNQVTDIIGGSKSMNISGLTNVNRISGRNRYETSVNIAKKCHNSNELILVDGRNYPDALSATSLTVKKNSSIMLVEDKQLSPIKQFIRQNKINRLVVIGGEKSIPNDTLTNLFKQLKETKKDEKVTLEKLEKERLEKAKKEKLEKERFEKAKKEKLEKERLEKERLEKERLEKAKKEAEEAKKPENIIRYNRLIPQSENDIDLTNFDINTPLSNKERELARMLNQYRVSKGLKPMPISKSLTYVARMHNKDQIQHFRIDLKDERGLEANCHSWSEYGPWTPMRYTHDHKYASRMHSKPRELTPFKVNGFENAVYLYRDGDIDFSTSMNIYPKRALDALKESPGHNAVMIGQGSWKDLKVMGVSIHNNFADIWFAKETNDPAGFHD